MFLIITTTDHFKFNFQVLPLTLYVKATQVRPLVVVVHVAEEIREQGKVDEAKQG